MNKTNIIPKGIVRDPRKRRAWVIYQLSIQGRSLAAVARDAGVKKQTLYRAFDIPYPRMEKAIADAVGMRPQMLFPERYDEDGLPNRRIGRPRNFTTHEAENNTGEGGCNCGAGRAA